VTLQPKLTLVDFFSESIGYERRFNLPFNQLNLCIAEDEKDPSVCTLLETGERFVSEAGLFNFTTCDVPLEMRFTPANRHLCVHFRCELLPGVDLFFGLHKRFVFRDWELMKQLTECFADTDPRRRLVKAQSIALSTILRFWPEQDPVDLQRQLQFDRVLRHVRSHIDNTLSVSALASLMGYSEGHFTRQFTAAFHLTPKQYLMRELFAKAVEILHTPDITVKEAAEVLKFSSEFNFSRFFKRLSGIAPSQISKELNIPFYIRK